MFNENELSTVFGVSDERFRNNFDNVLAKLQREGTPCHVNRTSPLAIVAAIAVFFLATATIAFNKDIKTFGKEIMEMFFATPAPLHDENGNEISFEYGAEPQTGYMRIEGLGDENEAIFTSQIVSCINGVAGKHIVQNGRSNIYINDGGTWALKSGQIVNIIFDVADDEHWGNQWRVNIGYCQDGKNILFGDVETEKIFILSGKTTVQFIAPEDGEYSFFMLNATIDPILVKSCMIAPQP